MFPAHSCKRSMPELFFHCKTIFKPIALPMHPPQDLFRNPLEQAPALGIALCLAAGIGLSAWDVVCRHMTADGWWVMTMIAVLLLVCTWIYSGGKAAISKRQDILQQIRSQRRQKRLFSLSAAVVLVAAGGTLGAWHTELTEVRWPSEPMGWEAQVVRVNRTDSADVQVDVALRNHDFDGKRMRLKIYGGTRLAVEEGDMLHFKGRIRLPRNAGHPYAFDYRAYLQHKGISGTAWCEGERCKVVKYDRVHTSVCLQWQTRMLRLRRTLLSAYAQHFEGNLLQVLSALTLGDRTALQADTRQVFSDSGASHVLALSGLHLGILYSLFHLLLLQWCRRKQVRMAVSLLGLVTLWAFVLLCGGGSSLVRSAGMLTAMALFRGMGRKVPPMQSLSLAALSMLLVDPFTLFDVGFQLSVTAVFSILYLEPCIQHLIAVKEEHLEWMKHPPLRSNYLSRHIWMKHRIRHSLNVSAWHLRGTVLGMLMVSVAAQVGTAPLVVYYFHTFSPYALLSSFWVIQLVWLVLMLSAVFFLIPVVRTGVAALLHVLLQLMVHGLTFLSSLPGASVRVYADGWWMAALMAGMVSVLYGWVQRRSRFKLAGCAVLAFCLGSYIYMERPGRVKPCIWVYPVQRGTAVHFVSSASRSYLLTTLAADTVFTALHQVETDFWQRKRMNRPTLLQPSFRNSEILCTPHAVAFGRLKVAWAEGIGHVPQNVHALQLDVLIVSHGTELPADELLRMFRPHEVVIDRSLPEWKRSLYHTAFKHQGIKVHDAPWHMEIDYP